MLSFIKIISLLLSSNAWATTTMEVGSKHHLNKGLSYHFSSKKLVTFHNTARGSFIVGLKIGDLHFKENSKPQRILILNKKQISFFNNASFIVESSPFLEWSVKSNKLIIEGDSTHNEFTSLLNICSARKIETVLIKTKSYKNSYSNAEKKCLGLSERFKIELAFLNENTLSGNTLGLGVPSELSWSINPSKTQFNSIAGSLNIGSQNKSSAGHSFFTATLEGGEPLIFESGSEVLIKPNGVFNRQQNEWKKASSSIELNIVESDNSFIKTKLKINRTERTGETKIFNIEKFEQLNTLKINQWEKIFVFQQSNKTASRTQAIWSSLLGKKNRSKNKTQKQFWVRVTE